MAAIATRQLRIVRFWPIAALAGVVVLFVLDPARTSWTPPCPFHALTGFYCPGCGSTRAIHQLLHGNLLAALKLNPLMVVLLPVIGYLSAISAGIRVRGRPLPRPHSAFGWVLFGLIMFHWIARNIPVAPLTYLAPR